MIKPRLLLYVCASAVAVTLGGSMLTYAAGPGEFISRLWKRDATPRKEVHSGFSPFGWLKRRESNSVAGHVKVSDDGRRVVSERPGLVSDPFLAEQQSHTGSAKESETASRIIVRPIPRSRDQQVAELVLTEKPVTASRLPHNNSSQREELSNVHQDRLPELTAEATSDRAASRRERPSAPRAGNQDRFVDNFDSEFQRLFREVIEESRQQKEQLSTPKLPDDVVADFGPTEEASPKGDSPMPDNRQRVVADFTPERSRESLDDLIQQSRSQMESSVLARQAAPAGQMPRSNAGTREQNSSLIVENSVSAVSHSASRVRSSEDGFQTNGGFQPGQLSDARAETNHQLIVPSSMVPDGKLFTPSTGPGNRESIQPQSVQRQDAAPTPQPVVRVVPGDRGNGVVIDSSRSAPARPRVSSNVAPTRSVPDTSQFRRLSFEGAATDAADGIIQSISDASPRATAPPVPDRLTDGTAFFQPRLSGSGISGSGRHAVGDIPLMMIPDSQADSSMDAAALGASLAAVPGPPVEKQMVFEWPDESEIGPTERARGSSWGFTLFCLAIAIGAVSVFFVRKSQAGAIGMIGTGTGSEIS